MIQWLFQHCDITVQAFRSFFSLRDYKKLPFLINGDQCVTVIIIVHIELFRIGKLHTVVKSKSRDICRCMLFFSCLYAQCTAQDKSYRQKYVGDYFFHLSAFFMLEESKFRV